MASPINKTTRPSGISMGLYRKNQGDHQEAQDEGSHSTLLAKTDCINCHSDLRGP